MENKKNNGIIVVLVIIILILIGLIIYFVVDKKFNNNSNSNNNEVINNQNDAKVVITDKEYAKPYYAIISPTNNVSVYQNKKVTSNDFTNEFMILNAIKYESLTDKSDVSKVNAENIKTYAEHLYNKKINTLPKTMAQYNSDVTADYTLEGSYYVLNEVYDKEYGNTLLDNVLFQKIEKDNEYIYLYDLIILNADIWENGCGYISKPDNTGKISLGDGDVCNQSITDLYNKYPDYFSKYKHTFKGIDYNVVYISSEPIK